MNNYYYSAAIDLSYYWQVLKTVFRKNIKQALLMAVMVGGITFLFNSMQEAQYKATTVMHVAAKSSAVFNLRELFLNRKDPAFRETQVGIMKSRILANKVVKRLELSKSPEFNMDRVTVLQKIKQKIGVGKRPDKVDSDRLIATWLISEMEISSQRDSYLMHISLVLPNAQLAADITNALAEEYISSIESNLRTSTESSEQWLLDRLEVVNEDLKLAEFALQEFKEKEEIIGSSQQNGGIVSQEVDMISSRLLEARQKRLGSEALYQQIRSVERGNGDVQGITAIRNDAIVQNIRNELVELESRQSELSQRYGPEHRRMVELASQVAVTEQNLKQQIQRVVSAIKSEYELAKESESFLKNSLGKSTNKVQSLGRKQFELLALEQNVRTQRDVYQAFLKRLNENRATGVSVNENVRITDPAVAATNALPSKGPLLVFMFSLLALVVGLAIGVLRELFDNTISSDRDVDKKLTTVSLGSVPMIEGENGIDDIKNVAYSYFSNHKLSQFSESVRTVRSSLMLSSIDETKRRILVTSTVPGEGKTSMAISLALAFGHVQKTLLIDCDLRRPSLDELLESAPFNRRRLGINDLCIGSASPSECIQSLPVNGVDLITAGTINPNPQELFCSTKFSEILNKLSEIYDVIIVDSPPSGGLSDSMLLGTQVDQVVYVVKANATPVAKVRSSIQALVKSGAPVSGVIVNQVPLSDSSFSYYYGRGYYADSVQSEGAEGQKVEPKEA